MKSVKGMAREIGDLTPYFDVNEILSYLKSEIATVLAKDLVGLYLFGSLTYDDFNPSRSDIDLVAILAKSASKAEIESLRRLHAETERLFPRWAKRTEVSYTPRQMLTSVSPPKDPRPYHGEGNFYPEASYGNEWIINNFLLYEHGIALTGPDFQTFMEKPDIREVQKACIRDFYKEWLPIIQNKEWLNNSHYQSYLILNCCRILYTVKCAKLGSKKNAAVWVKTEYSPWAGLIHAAEDWKYGKEMKLSERVAEFILFVRSEIEKSTLFDEVTK